MSLFFSFFFFCSFSFSFKVPETVSRRFIEHLQNTFLCFCHIFLSSVQVFNNTMASSGIAISAKAVQVSDIPRFLQTWIRESLVPTCDVKKVTANGIAYELSLFDPMMKLSRKLYVKLPAAVKNCLRLHTGDYGGYFTITDPEVKRLMEELLDPFADAMQEKCGNRGEVPAVEFSPYIKWMSVKSDPNAFMAELHSSPDYEPVLLLSGAYHNTKEGKNIVKLEWSVSQYVSKPMVTKVRAGKKRSVAEAALTEDTKMEA